MTTAEKPPVRAPQNFAVIGVGGFVAPRHLEAIKTTGNRLVAATDPHDAVGILDRHAFDVRFFPEIERFDRHLDKLRRGRPEDRVHWVSVCSPNYLHDAHIRLGLRVGANVICEKPIVINPWNLDALEEMEQETGRTVNTVLQLRVHPQLVAAREKILAAPAGERHDVVLTYITARGAWYDVSWKGLEERSGGVVTNIGIHLFDLMIWLFGGVQDFTVHAHDKRRVSGVIELERARVRWYLSVNPGDLPFAPTPGGRMTFRSLTVNGQELEFSDGFGDLHARIYEDALAGRGFRIGDARPSIELTSKLRRAEVEPGADRRHPFLR